MFWASLRFEVVHQQLKIQSIIKSKTSRASSEATTIFSRPKPTCQMNIVFQTHAVSHLSFERVLQLESLFKQVHRAASLFEASPTAGHPPPTRYPHRVKSSPSCFAPRNAPHGRSWLRPAPPHHTHGETANDAASSATEVVRATDVRRSFSLRSASERGSTGSGGTIASRCGAWRTRRCPE